MDEPISIKCVTCNIETVIEDVVTKSDFINEHYLKGHHVEEIHNGNVIGVWEGIDD